MSAWRAGLVGVAVVACAPVFPEDSQVVEGPRILAMRSIPAEARPREPVTWEALVVGPDGAITTPPQWAWCSLPRRVEEPTAVSAACGAGEGLVPTAPEAIVPAEACSRFGPTPLPPEEDEPERRPADPDASGGYHQPIRALVTSDPDAVAFGRVRVRCDLAGATRRIFDAFEARYTTNAHPVLTAMRAVPSDGAFEVEVEVDPTSAEAYVIYRPETSELVDAIERLDVTWYATGGTLDTARTAVEDGTSRVRWIPDEAADAVRIWAILRDDRGGSHWLELEVTP